MPLLFLTSYTDSFLFLFLQALLGYRSAADFLFGACYAPHSAVAFFFAASCLLNAYHGPFIAVSITINAMVSTVVGNFFPRWTRPHGSCTRTIV